MATAQEKGFKVGDFAIFVELSLDNIPPVIPPEPKRLISTSQTISAGEITELTNTSTIIRRITSSSPSLEIMSGEEVIFPSNFDEFLGDENEKRRSEINDLGYDYLLLNDDSGKPKSIEIVDLTKAV